MAEASSDSNETNRAPESDPLEDRFEDTFRRDYPLLWFLTLTAPILVSLVLAFLIYLWAGWRFLWGLLIVAVASFFAVGKFAILYGTEGHVGSVENLSTIQLFLLIFYMDMMTALLLVFHIGFVYKLPFLGPKLRDVAQDGHYILETNPWMRRATFVGLVAFVMFPLAATGSVGGSIFSRLLGMGRLSALTAIAIGSLLGCGAMYFGANAMNRLVENEIARWGGVAAVILIVLLLNYRYKQLKKRHLQQRSQPRSDSSARPGG